MNQTNRRDSTITRLSGLRSLARLKQYWTIPGFKIRGEYILGDESRYKFDSDGGITLESLGADGLRTACIAVGTPERDQSGRITNAVIINPYYSGDSAWCYYFWFEGQPGNDFSTGPVVGPGKLIDTERFTSSSSTPSAYGAPPNPATGSACVSLNTHSPTAFRPTIFCSGTTSTWPG